MKVSIDNLILNVEDVSPELIGTLQYRLEVAETYGKIPKVKQYIGVGISKYHYNLVIGDGGGAAHIGWKHNGQKENQRGYRLRLEVNPSKNNTDGMDAFKEIFADVFKNSRKLIKGVDIAYDVPIDMKDIMPVSLTGRTRNRIKDTLFFGGRGGGQLKVYDKKKELQQKQGIQIPEEHLTRIEYSMRLDEPMNINFFSKFNDMNISELYQVSHLETGQVDGVVKACIIAINSGQMEMKELSRTYQAKTKKALAAMGLLDLDQGYTNAKEELLKQIQCYLVVSNDTTLTV